MWLPDHTAQLTCDHRLSEPPTRPTQRASHRFQHTLLSPLLFVSSQDPGCSYLEGKQTLLVCYTLLMPYTPAQASSLWGQCAVVFHSWEKFVRLRLPFQWYQTNNFLGLLCQTASQPSVPHLSYWQRCNGSEVQWIRNQKAKEEMLMDCALQRR